MLIKTALIAFTCTGFISGLRIIPRDKRQINAFGTIGGIISNIPGIPNNSSIQKIPGLTDIPSQSARVPSKTEIPQALKVSSTTVPTIERVRTSAEPFDAPGEFDPSSITHTSDTTNIPYKWGAWSTTETSDTPNAPDKSDASSTTETSDTSNLPSVQNSPAPLKTSGIPNIPGVPSIPTIPGFSSGTSDIPSAPDIPNGINPNNGISVGIGKGISDGAIHNFGSGISQVADGVVNRFKNAVNQTYQEEKNSMKDSFDSVKNLIHQKFETGANLTKTSFDLGTMGPKFFKHLIIN